MTAPHNPPTAREDEHFEHIPWEHLSASTSGRRWWIYLASGALVVAALTASLVRNSSPARQGTAVDVLPAPAVTEVTPEATLASPTSTTSSVAPYSEADLMAVAPDSLLAEAAAMAAWIASDFFTVDGSGAIASDLELILPAGSSLPSTIEGQRSFVEWSRALGVDEIAPGRYRVIVVVRTLGAGPGEDYRRLGPRAVLLDLQWTPDGWSLLDLPSPVALPTTVQMPAWPSQDLPPVVSQAASTGGGIVLDGGRVGNYWRVVVEVPDEAGSRWPQVLWFDEAGSRMAPPAG
jgi:hypothetical protein